MTTLFDIVIGDWCLPPSLGHKNNNIITYTYRHSIWRFVGFFSLEILILLPEKMRWDMSPEALGRPQQCSTCPVPFSHSFT